MDENGNVKEGECAKVWLPKSIYNGRVGRVQSVRENDHPQLALVIFGNEARYFKLTNLIPVEGDDCFNLKEN